MRFIITKTACLFIVSVVLHGKPVMHRTDESKKESRDVKSRLAVIRMLITIWLVFIVCWGPFLTLTLVERLAKDWLFDRVYYEDWNRLYPTLHLITMANSALNPVLYAFLSR